tara:strand:- start:2670 stop:3059 length:390 start_codon:yes stop_codon:yes gene_type:complete
MKWIQVRQGSSASAGTWEYMQVPDTCKTAEDVEEHMDDNHMLNKWSEHYRGIEVVFIRKIPQIEIDDRIKRTKSLIKSLKEDLKELQTLEPCKVDIRVVERNRQRKNHIRAMNKMWKNKGRKDLIQPVK